MPSARALRKEAPFKQFEQKYSFYIPETHKNFLSDDDMEGFLSARYAFFRERTDDLKVNVSDPNSEFPWLINSCVVEILMSDSPFIVDTVVDTCKEEGYKIRVIIHPILSVQRDPRGRLQQVEFPGTLDNHESYVYLEINRLSQQELQRLQRNITNNLRELRRVVTDYPKMIAKANRLEIQDPQVAGEFKWLRENFVLLGMSHIKSRQPGAPYFGILRKAAMRKNIHQLMDGLSKLKSNDAIDYQETELHSSVNKNRRLYLVRLQDQKMTLLLAGHFRHRADIALRYNIPAVRRMVDSMAEELRVTETSYLRKELYKTAQGLPVGLLLTRSKAFLMQWFLKIISSMYTTEVSHDLSIDQEHNILWAQVILPDTDKGKIPGRSLRAFIEEHDIELVDIFRHHLNQVEVVFMGFRSPNYTPHALKKMLKTRTHELFSTWSSRFRELVFLRHSGKENINRLLNRYLSGMSPDYEVHQEPDEVLRDLITLDDMQDSDGYLVRYYHREISGEDLIKIYATHAAQLSELVPILSNFGFDINRNFTFPYSPNRERKFTYVFSVPENPTLSKEDRKRISTSVADVLNKRLTSRPINALVLAAGLTARELNLAKAFCAYFYKIDNSFAFSSIQRVMVAYPEFTKSLITFFKARFDPKAKSAQVTRTLQAVENAFGQLRSVEDEKICRSLLNIVNAMVRTNYFLERPEISFKISSEKIDIMPQPVPHFEIYIYSHEMEGIHLRGGAVARGGIRWSDRQDDLRTEILGLMKAQMVKNTVIVPVGSKGGFVVKNRQISDRQEWFRVGKDVYKRFIHNLLELTDNLSPDGKVIPAPEIKRLDDDDPYFVVAADKGTATFSDLANEISVARKFWLTDAFASGGSNGYDHKRQGITAKGAWESVKRHFHEIGIDPERHPVRVVGIGDMGGDVFGNGMLLSHTLKLIAAFNHLYIFLDPDPDPEQSYHERARLFKKGGNWNDYDETVISKGGGVFDRSSRRIALSPEVRQALGIRAKALSGEELIKAILRAPVDLLWNGGIGTYVKANSESHFQAGDPANDRVRIDASELGVAVIAEGGNLGLTQAARVQAAHQGVRLNSDAIDNSAGVNMSDHEVNLKILLDSLVRQKSLKGVEERNRIIRACEPDEIELVLARNYDINLGLSVDYRRAPTQFLYLRALIKFLNRMRLFDRGKDCIPYEADLDRLEQGSKTLSRPVLCSLLGFAKLYGARVFLESDKFNDPWYDRFILRYFPDDITQRFESQIKSHPLKREIIVTEILNDIVSHAGLAFFQRMHMETGKPLVDIAEAYLRLSEFLNAGELRKHVEKQDEWLNATIHYDYLIFLEEKLYQLSKRLLRDQELLGLLDEEDTAEFNRMLREAARHSRYRIPRKLHITMRMLTSDHAIAVKDAFKQIDVLEDTFNIFINNKSGEKPWNVVEYFTILQQYHINELRKIAENLSPASGWEMRFISKIETAIESLISGIVQLRHAEKPQTFNAIKDKVKAIVNEIIAQDNEGKLSTAGFFEMLEYINEELLGEEVLTDKTNKLVA